MPLESQVLANCAILRANKALNKTRVIDRVSGVNNRKQLILKIDSVAHVIPKK
jgi:hypothetical protein